MRPSLAHAEARCAGACTETIRPRPPVMTAIAAEMAARCAGGIEGDGVGSGRVFGCATTGDAGWLPAPKASNRPVSAQTAHSSESATSTTAKPDRMKATESIKSMVFGRPP